MEPTKEQIKEFWKRIGFSMDGVGIWHCPDGINEMRDVPPLDLNNLFRWAVPKLKGVMGGRRLEEIHLYPSEDGWLCELDMVLMEYSEYTAEKCKVEYARDYPAKDPALALFWAIYKVIKEE